LVGASRILTRQHLDGKWEEAKIDVYPPKIDLHLNSSQLPARASDEPCAHIFFCAHVVAARQCRAATMDVLAGKEKDCCAAMGQCISERLRSL